MVCEARGLQHVTAEGCTQVLVAGNTASFRVVLTKNAIQVASMTCAEARVLAAALSSAAKRAEQAYAQHQKKAVGSVVSKEKVP